GQAAVLDELLELPLPFRLANLVVGAAEVPAGGLGGDMLSEATAQPRQGGELLRTGAVAWIVPRCRLAGVAGGGAVGGGVGPGVTRGRRGGPARAARGPR